jgi:hypothetical protein
MAPGKGGIHDVRGGGAMKLVVAGRLKLDGRISSDGTHEFYASHGGSIWIVCKDLTGSGSLRANGGSGNNPGRGGRIAVWFKTNTFNGRMEARSGIPKGGNNPVGKLNGSVVQKKY